MILQDFTFNIDPNGNIKKNWTRTDYTYEEFSLKLNKYIEEIMYNNKILLNIFIIKDKFYISETYLQTIVKDTVYSRIPIYKWFSRYLFTNEIKYEDIKNFTKEYLKLEYKYIQYNNEIIKVINFNNFIENEELKIIYDLTKTSDFNSKIIEICGLKNKQEQEYYNFIFKNIHFNFINYISDIDKLKEKYDLQILELINKLDLLIAS